MLPRRILLGSIAAPAVVLVAVSLAWACVPQGSFTLNPTEGAAGSQVSASGRGFEVGTVEIRWESRTGPILATTTGPDFNNVPITIPASAEPGVHYVSAANTGEHGDHSATAASFEVKGAAPPAEQPGATTPPPSQQPAPSPPAPSPPADPVKQGPSPRAAAIKKCKRKYRVKGVKSASKKRRMTKKRKACLKRAKRLSNSNASAAFGFASQPLFGSTAAVRE